MASAHRCWSHHSWSGTLIRSFSLVLLGLTAACGGSGTGGGAANSTGGSTLLALHSGRLVDVYGILGDGQGNSTGAVELYQKDVLVGTDIQDERGVGEQKKDSEILYDFVSSDPQTLQPKLLITRILGSREFDKAFDALDDHAQLIAAGAYGQNLVTQPFNVSGRNAAIRLTFSRDLGLPEDFFIAYDEQGRPKGLKNPEAVEMLEIVGDPTDQDPIGDFKRIPVRIAHRKNLILLDPVLMGVEGSQLQVSNRASGMPASATQAQPNIRINLALEGPLRIPGVTARTDPRFIQTNLAGRKALVRDFRSGNQLDTNIGLQNGFLRDKVPPYLIGKMPMRLEKVERISETEQWLTIYKAGVIHEMDRGDVLELYAGASTSSLPTTVSEIIEEPQDDQGVPMEQRVRVRVRNVDAWAPWDPSKKPGFPPGLKERGRWLLTNAPLVMLSAEFFGGDPKKGTGDDPRNFLSFNPNPIPDTASAQLGPGENVSPFANFLIRFSKPVNPATVRPYDSLILSTLASPADILDPKKGTPHLIAHHIFDEDGSSTTLRVAPPMGLYLDESMRQSGKKAWPYYLHIIGGFTGIRDFAGNPVDFSWTNRKPSELSALSFEFFLDINKDGGHDRFPDNRVVSLVRRFASADEDESAKGELDSFGPIAVVGGQVIGRPLSRSSSFVDDRNQLPSPVNFPFSFCQPGQLQLTTGSNPVGAPILNPLNPWGGRLENVWREIDLNLSRTNPADFNLDVEQMWWAPWQRGSGVPRTIIYDIFDRVSLYLGHSEYRPESCVAAGNWPQYTRSGLQIYFDSNFARNLKITATNKINPNASDYEDRPDPHIAFESQQLVIQEKDVAKDPTGTVRYLPLPTFAKDKGYFVFRDEALTVTGGGQGQPSILSPFGPSSQRRWDGRSSSLQQGDGRIGSIGLPILADFWSYVDDAKLPKDDPFFATGANGLQLSICVTALRAPAFRIYSGGSLVLAQNAKYVRPGDRDWKIASGGWNPLTGARTPSTDPTQYWMRFDWLRRKSYMTYGFVDLQDVHLDSLHKYGDPRLGSNGAHKITPQQLCRFQESFEPPLAELPAGTLIQAQFRVSDQAQASMKFLDPRLPGDAHIRSASGNQWTYKYTNRLSAYTSDPNQLFENAWLAPFGMDASRPRIMNWRFLFQNNVKSATPRPPVLDSWSLTWRIESRPR